MPKEENRSNSRKAIRERAKRRKELIRDEKLEEGSATEKNLWVSWGKQFFLSLAFAVALIFIRFVGQDPPSLRTLGEVVPENVYSDRAFQYLSDVRRAEAEEWIRSSTPREFAQNFAGQENFLKALIRLEEGLLTIETLPEETKGQAFLSLTGEIEMGPNVVEAIPSPPAAGYTDAEFEGSLLNHISGYRGQVEIKNDKDGNIGTTIGRKSFTIDNLLNNFKHLLDFIKKEKPETIKGEFIKKVYLTSTMGVSFKINNKIL